MSNFGQGGIIRGDKSLFTVQCEKIGKGTWFKVAFPPNNQLNERIKLTAKHHHKWSFEDHCWHLHIKALYEIIKIYRKSDKIKFEFGAEGRVLFLEQIKKIDEVLEVKADKLERLKQKNTEALAWKKELDENYQKYEADVLKFLKSDIKLYPHQVVAVMFLKKVINGLLSLEMGLGKTLCSIGYAEMMGFKKVLVITPNSLKYNYFDEVKKFTNGSKPHIIKQKPKTKKQKEKEANSKIKVVPKVNREQDEANYVIVNYDYFNGADFKRVNQKFKDLNLGFIECVVLDESHMIKNTQSNTYKNIKKLIKEIPSKVFLSGTPAPNRTKELFTVLNMISPLDFPTKTEFYEQYCGLTYIPKGKDDDPENDESWDRSKGWQQSEGGMRLEELYHKIAPYTYRKRKFEVLKDLPDKIYQKIVLEMTDEQQEQYNKIEEGVANEIFGDEQMSSVNILTIMLRLRQYTSMIKVPPTVDLAKRLLDEDEKSVIVDMFKPPIAEMKKLLGDVGGLHTGDEDMEERNAVKNEFQDPNGKIKVFLASIATTKYGLTLTAASKLFMTTLPWSTGEYDQVSDRLHRIGQKDTVFIYPVIVKDTIDEYVFNMIEKKRIEITKVLDNEDYQSNVEESVLSEVLAMLREKYGKKKDQGDGTSPATE
jgi:SWI/SNF-related matrix-associated actin-dependent regulator 1 of chromatin subfamily A